MTSFCTHWQFTLECDALFQNKINDSYLNQAEYSVLGNSSTFKYTCLFADFCGLFSYHSQTKKLQHRLFNNFQSL